jgi:DNA-binding MarR family transcriptional regulator
MELDSKQAKLYNRMEYVTPDPIAKLSDLLVRASWRLRQNERKELAPFGLTFGQARALRLISAAGGHVEVCEPADDGMRIGELAGRLEIVPRSATTMVDGLESAGLVARRMDPSDRRSVLVTCTAQGKGLIARLDQERRSGAEALFAPLSVEQKEELLRLLALLTGER